MELGRLNHIGVATPSIAESIVFYRDVLGATKIHEPFDLPDQGVKVCFVDTPGADGALNGTQIELIEPLPGNTSIAAFLDKNPAGGQHHMCYEVPDIHAAKAEFEFLYDKPYWSWMSPRSARPNNETRAELANFLLPEVKRIETVLGRDLSVWYSKW